MKLTKIFHAALKDSNSMVTLFDKLSTKNVRAVRSDWKDNFFDSKLTAWPSNGGLWRSTNKTNNILIIGTAAAGLTHKDFNTNALSILLRLALVMSMAAIDKILHEAISQKFAIAVKSGKLNKLITLEISKSYEIAMAARKHTGKGGKRRIRPASHMKKAVLEKLYRQTFLSKDLLNSVCKALEVESIFEEYGGTFTPHRTAKDIGEEWSNLYKRRNQITHECDILRKQKMRKIHRHKFSAVELQRHISTINKFGEFLSKKLE